MDFLFSKVNPLKSLQRSNYTPGMKCLHGHVTSSAIIR